MTADPFDSVWPADQQDISAALRAVPAEPVPVELPGGRHVLDRPRFTPHRQPARPPARPWSPPLTPARLGQVAHALRHLDDQPVPDDGRLRGLLARMAAYAADVTEPLFMDTCEHCGTAPCGRHAGQLAESAMFRRLALSLGAAATDRDAFAFIAAAASNHRETAGPAWPGQRDRSVALLTAAESAALPDMSGCCSDEEPCADHAADEEAAGFVGAIRDAAIDAGSVAEAAALITEVITGGGR